MKFAAHDRRMVLGITGSGKSHHTAHDIIAPARRVVVFDPHDEYATRGDDAYGEVTGLERIELWQLDDYIDRPDCRVAVVPEWSTDLDELAEEFAMLVECVRASDGGFLLVVEEVGLLTGHFTNDNGRRVSAAGLLTLLACQARHWGVALALVAQAATQVPKLARRQVSQLVSFRQTDSDDIDALARIIGRKKADRIAELPRRKFVAWAESEAFNKGGARAAGRV